MFFFFKVGKGTSCVSRRSKKVTFGLELIKLDLIFGWKCKRSLKLLTPKCQTFYEKRFYLLSLPL